MKFIEARELILTKLYEANRDPGVGTEETNFVQQNFQVANAAVANTVLSDLEVRGFIRRSNGDVFLTMDGVYEAEKLTDHRSYPQPEKSANYVALYSAIVATYISVLALLPGYIEQALLNYCVESPRSENPWCEYTLMSRIYPGSSVYPRPFWDSVVTSTLFWATFLAIVGSSVAWLITRRWARK